MKSLRLLLLKECNRSCAGCCNKEWDLDALPICQSFQGYDEIILTGGEPFLKPELILSTILKIKLENPIAKIFVYTAKTDTENKYLINILDLIDGLTVTLHEQEDVKDFCFFTGWIRKNNFSHLSLRLNIFKGVKINSFWKLGWKVKDNIEWIKNCPLPKNEVFMRLK